MTAPADFEARDLARFDLAKNIVVEAGAGTGKTTLLIHRLVSLILGSVEPPTIDSIVALTFTEKAAEEIKMRLAAGLSDVLAVLEGGQVKEEVRQRTRDFIGEIHTRFGQSEDEILSRCRRSLTDLDKAPIGTIHSFASRLLRTYPVEAGVDPDFTVDDSGRLFNELFESEWARWLDTELGETPPQADAWLEVLTQAPLASVEELARALCREDANLSVTAKAEPQIAAGLFAMVDALRLVSQDQPKPKGKIMESLAEITTRLVALSEAAAQDNPPWPSVEDRGTIKERSWPTTWDNSHEALYQKAVKIASKSSAWDEALVRRAARLLIPFCDFFRRMYTRRGFISFDGLLRRARDLVRDHPEVREELKSRYRFFLIDEFQDTDPLQGEMLMFLAEAKGACAKRWQDVRLSLGKIFVVGDPKQSIYRFRGADIAAYQRFSEFILSQPGAAACALTSNFRSCAEILAPVNAIFPKIMKLEKDLQPDYKELVPAKGAARSAQAAIEMVIVGADDEDKSPKADAARQLQFAWIAQWMVEHCGPGKKRGFKDVAVLLRSSTALLPLLDALKSAGIPYAVEMEKNFYGAPEVLDFVNLLSALDDPADKIALVGLLRSPLAALDDEELYRLARKKSLSYLKDPPAGLLSAQSQKRISGLFAALRGLRAQVGRASLGDLVRRVLDQTPLLELSSCAYHGEQSVANILKFARLAMDASESGGRSLKEFIDFIRLEADDSSREGESPLADEHLEAVRILSIHKAKGLEFSVVFLADVSAQSNRSGNKEPAILTDWSSTALGLRLPKIADNAAMAYLEERRREQQEYETVRLLYVAMTRAKERLFVLGAKKPGAGSLAFWLLRADAWPANVLGGLNIPVHWLGADQEVSSDKSKSRKPIAPDEAVDISQLAGLWKKRLESRDAVMARKWFGAPTDYLGEPEKGLVADDDVQSISNSLFTISANRESEVGSGERGALLGQLCHKVLQGWDFGSAAEQDSMAAVERAAASLKRLKPLANWLEIIKDAAGILEKFIVSSAAKELAGAEVLGREIPFIYGEDGAVMRGSIDLLYRKGKNLVVADYKSEKITAKELKAKREKYARQGQAYCRAVEKALNVKDVSFRLIFLRDPELA